MCNYDASYRTGSSGSFVRYFCKNNLYIARKPNIVENSLTPHANSLIVHFWRNILSVLSGSLRLTSMSSSVLLMLTIKETTNFNIELQLFLELIFLCSLSISGHLESAYAQNISAATAPGPYFPAFGNCFIK